MGKRKCAPKKIGTCSDCKKEKTLATKTACAKCYKQLHAPKIKCAGCGSTDRPRNGKNADGYPVCINCYTKLGIQPKTKCDHCGSDNYPRHGTTSDGNSVCLNCYGKLNLRPKITCANCQSQDFPQHGKLPDGRGICEGCYTKLDLRPKRLCSNCGDTNRPQHGTTAEGNPVCEGCYNTLGLRPTMDCENCDAKDQQRGGTTAEGKAVCKNCYHKLGLCPTITCAECGSDDRPRCGENKDGKAVCLNCYGRLGLRPNTKCVGCGSDERPRKGSTEDGEALCTNCYKPHPCPEDGCEYMGKTLPLIATHARTHGPWRWRSLMEEWTHTQLVAAGFQQSWPCMDPEAGPEQGKFWYNSRVFSSLRGVGGKHLECDFMVCLPHNRLLWIELQGKQHYVPWALASLSLEEIQEHDRRRMEFATKQLPQESKEWTNLEFKEVPYFEFETQFKSWFKQLLVETTQTNEDNAVDCKRRRLDCFAPHNTTIDQYFSPVPAPDVSEVKAQP